jgi:hypothetical protein
MYLVLNYFPLPLGTCKVATSKYMAEKFQNNVIKLKKKSLSNHQDNHIFKKKK